MAGMKVAALQWDVRREAVEENLEAAQAALEEALAAEARLVVLPELWATSFPGPDAAGDAGLLRAAERAQEWAREASRQFEIAVAGSYLAPASGAARRFRNRLVVFDAGEPILEYDKAHLFRPTAEHEVFEAGDALPAVVESSAGRLSGVVCYDLRFGEVFSHLIEGGVEVVVCPAQWASPRAVHWRALVVGRAVEIQATVVAANRLGVEPLGSRGRVVEFPGNSLVVDGHGHVSGEGAGAAGAVVGELDREEGRALRIRVPVRKDRRREVYGCE
jgi:predicted amidohydrolase